MKYNPAHLVAREKADEIIDVQEEVDISSDLAGYKTWYYLVKTKAGHHYSVVRTSDGLRYQERVYLGKESNRANLITSIIGAEESTAGPYWMNFIEHFVPSSKKK